MTAPRFFLHGILGVYNYGCEAIVRSTADILRSVWPESQILYLSRRPDEDRLALAECPVEVLDNRPPSRRQPRRMLKGLLRRLRLPHDWIQFEKLGSLGPGDCLISIGGDIFTLPRGPYPNQGRVKELDVPRRILSAGRPFVLWAASVGPFDAWPTSIPAYRETLQRLTLITVREPETLRYLEKLGVEGNLAEVADPAFLMPQKAVDSDWPFPPDRQPTIGVNLSPLSVIYASGANALDATAERQAAFLDQVRNRLGARLLLIPHVIAPHQPVDDDYGYLETILKLMKTGKDNSVALLPPTLGARRTKGVITKCEILIAARMHCAIAGVSSAVPTLFASYSAKAKGMSEFVYGDNRWEIPVERLITSHGFDQVAALYEERRVLSDRLLAKHARFREMALAAGAALKRKLS